MTTMQGAGFRACCLLEMLGKKMGWWTWVTGTLKNLDVHTLDAVLDAVLVLCRRMRLQRALHCPNPPHVPGIRHRSAAH